MDSKEKKQPVTKSQDLGITVDRESEFSEWYKSFKHYFLDLFYIKMICFSLLISEMRIRNCFFFAHLFCWQVCSSCNESRND